MVRVILAVVCLRFAMAAVATWPTLGPRLPVPKTDKDLEMAILSELRELKGTLAKQADPPAENAILGELRELKGMLATQASLSLENTILGELRELKGSVATQAGGKTVLEELMLEVKNVLATRAAQSWIQTTSDMLVELKGFISESRLQKHHQYRCDNSGQVLHEAVQRQAEMVSKVQSLENAGEDSRNVIESLQDVVAALKNDNSALRGDVSVLTKEAVELRNAYTTQKNEVAILKNSGVALRNDCLALKDDVDEIRGRRGLPVPGTSYVRWGHAGCPHPAELVYSGVAGGSLYISRGGAGNHLCLTSHPVFDTDHNEQPPGSLYAEIHASEYEDCPGGGCYTIAACAVCRVPRATSTVMIPATNSCSAGWTLEYSGHIMAGNPDHSGNSDFICVDSSLGRYGSESGGSGNLLHYTYIYCGALGCPPFDSNKIVTCVVCSK